MKDKDHYFNIIKNYKRLSSNLISDIANYNWDSDFCKKRVTDLYNKLIKEFDGLDFLQFSEKELIENFDFNFFDENLLCMPVWVLKCLKEGTEIYSINEEKLYSNKNLDTESRYGVTAYGFIKSQLRDSKIESILT